MTVFNDRRCQHAVEAEKIEEPPSRRPEPRPHPETTEQFAEVDVQK